MNVYYDYQFMMLFLVLHCTCFVYMHMFVSDCSEILFAPIQVSLLQSGANLNMYYWCEYLLLYLLLLLTT